MATILYLYAQPYRAGSDHARRTVQMLSLLKACGHAVDVLTLSGGDVWPEGLVRQRYLTSRVPFVKTLPFYGRGFRRFWAGVVMFFAALRLAFRERYDAVHCSDRAIRTGGFLSWLFRKPFIFEWHATHSGHDLVKWLSRRSRRFRRSINMIFSDFPYPSSRFRQIGVYGRIAILPLLPSPTIEPQSLPAVRMYSETQNFRLVAFSATEDLQDFSPLCHVLPTLLERYPLHLSLIGATPKAMERLRRQLQAQLGDLALRVALRPALYCTDEVLRATREADLVYLSAVPGPLPPPLLIDLMAARKALLVIQCPAFQTLLSPTNATLVPYDAQAIGNAIVHHLQRPLLCAEHAQAAYDTIHTERNARVVVEEVRRCYELALKEMSV
ncbi:MAG: glycosyltransferase [bacterium]|nr:glycosyltransferase [bacterium]